MLKGINTLTNAARKAKYLSHSTTPTTLSPNQMKILEDVRSEWNAEPVRKTLSQLDKKLSELRSMYSTDKRTLRINGRDTVVTEFKGSISGSNEGFWITTTGKDLKYVKFPKVEQQAYSEILASELYNLAGIPTPKLTNAKEMLPKLRSWDHQKIKNGVISEFVPIERELTAADSKLAREGFGMDCWLANWDALKEGNTVISNGKALRLDVGGSLSYRARGAHKTGEQFGENVNELTTFFDGFSHSKRYIKDMTKDELISSLERVTNLSDLKVKDLIKKAANYHFGLNGVVYTQELNNPNYLTEVLLARKKYIKLFVDKCKSTPQKTGETIEQYIRRIDSTMPKKQYKLNYDNIVMSDEVKGVNGLTLGECLTPSQKQLYEESYEAYLTSKNRNLASLGISHPFIGQQELLHGTAYNKESFSKILENGIISGDITGKSGTGVPTQTPLCGDFWEVLNNCSIKDYFSRKTWNRGEKTFYLY